MRGKGEGAVYKDKRTGLWTAVVELPPKDGKRRRKWIRHKDKREVLERLDRARTQLKARGDLPSHDQTVEQWFTYWLGQVAARTVRPKTFLGYRSAVSLWVIPTIGKVRLERLTPAHLRRVADALRDAGRSPTYALNVHRIMSSSLEDALREGRIANNPAKRMAAPRKAAVEMEALELGEALKLLEYATHQDATYGARWATAMLTGARRGEVLGLEYDRVSDILDLSWQLQRLPTVDGKPVAPDDFEWRHVRGGLFLTRPKTQRSKRGIPLVDPLRTILEQHIAAHPNNPHGLVFVRPDGNPIDPDQDSKEWPKIRRQLGIERNVVLHGLRHTAVDLLYLAGVPEDLITEIVGHSQRAMTRAYKSKANRARLLTAMQQLSELIQQPDTQRAIGQ